MRFILILKNDEIYETFNVNIKYKEYIVYGVYIQTINMTVKYSLVDILGSFMLVGLYFAISGTHVSKGASSCFSTSFCATT